MFFLHLFFLQLLVLAESNVTYQPQNIPHDDLSDDMNNVDEDGEDWAGMGWSHVFKEVYEEEKRHSESETNLDGTNFEDPAGGLELVEGWPFKPLPLGQVGGVAVDSRGLLHIFHRADRKWGYRTFDHNHTYKGNQKKIEANTLMVLNGNDGKVVEEWGKDLFLLPHGLEIDPQDNIYVTDVALHQVFKFKAGQRDPVFTLGMAYSPARSNDDLERFCMPSSVAAAADDDDDGVFFVADGYCNSRILKYSSNGKYMGKFGEDDFNIPHSLALLEKEDILCVADRENMRVLCYNAGLKDASLLGTKLDQFIHPRVGPVYAIAYNPIDSLIYGVTGRTGDLKPVGFTLDVLRNSSYPKDFVSFWSPSRFHEGQDEDEDEDEVEEVEEREDDDDDDEEFKNPHAIATRGHEVFVGEIGPNVVWKFKKRITRMMHEGIME